MKKTILTIIFTISLGMGLASAQTLQDGLRAIEFEKYEGAKKIFNKLIAENPAKGDYYYYLGKVFIYTSKEDSAAVIFNKGIAAAPDFGANYAGLGEVKILHDSLTEAELLFARAMGFKKGKDVFTIRAISYAYLTKGNTYSDKALEYANKALELNKNDNDNYVLLGDIYLEKLDAGKAATNYERSMDVDPKDPKPYVKVANIWLRLKNVTATLEALNKAIELDSNYAPAYKTFAKLYFQAQQQDKARASYNRYLDLSERSTDNQRQFVNILILGERYKEALEIINEILLVEKDDIYLYRLKAYSMYEVGVTDRIDSIGYYQEGIRSLDKFMAQAAPGKVLPSDYAYKGKLLSKAGQDSLGIATMLKALETDSSDIELYNEIGKIYNKMRRYADAAHYFDRYISKKASPNVLDYYYSARAFYYSNQYGKADTAYMRLLELKPDYAEAYYSRGTANAAIDVEYKDTVAKFMFEKYISMAESDPKKNKKNLVDSYTYLAVYSVKHDQNDTAKMYFQKVLAIDPTNKTATDALKQLK